MTQHYMPIVEGAVTIVRRTPADPIQTAAVENNTLTLQNFGNLWYDFTWPYTNPAPILIFPFEMPKENGCNHN